MADNTAGLCNSLLIFVITLFSFFFNHHTESHKNFLLQLFFVRINKGSQENSCSELINDSDFYTDSTLIQSRILQLLKRLAEQN